MVEHVLLLHREDDASNSNAIRLSILACAFFAMVCWSVSILSGNYSQVDKLWSITPVIYAWILVVDIRTFVMATVVTVWGVRLTANFARRGGYSWPPWEGDEDYRWKCVREGKLLSILRNPIAWQIFHLGFISIYQNLLLWLLVAPSVTAHLVAVTSCGTASETRGLGLGDYVSLAIFLCCVFVEAKADDQQYRFQTTKHQLLAKNHEELYGDYADGFCQSGLFAIVRKPNYAAEQVLWASYCGFAYTALGNRHDLFSVSGSLLLIMLFQGSGYLTELVSCEKYPKYAEYQERVPLYVPCIWPRRRLLKPKGD